MIVDLTLLAGTRDRVLEALRRYSEAAIVPLKKSVIEESDKSPRGAAQILESGERRPK